MGLGCQYVEGDSTSNGQPHGYVHARGLGVGLHLKAVQKSAMSHMRGRRSVSSISAMSY